MSPFLNLPNELLSRVSHFVRPADLLAFALTSKLIYNLAQAALDRHRELSKRYSLLSIGSLESLSDTIDARNVDDTHHALLLLGTILQDPDVAYHTRDMLIGDCGFDESENLYEQIQEEILGLRQSIVTNHSVQLQQLVDECPFVAHEWKEYLKKLLLQPGNEHGAVCLLLTLLPNLKHVHLEDWSYCSDTLRHIVGQIAEANRDAASLHHGKALSLLAECSMNHGDTEAGESVDGYGVFAMLPSIRTLRGTQIRGEQSDWPTELRPRSSTVTNIEFTYSAIDVETFHGLLEGIRCLKKFTYAYGGGNVGDAEYKPIGIIDALRKTASQSLELLDIEGLHETYDDYAEGDDKSVGSLIMFTVLKKIRLEDTIFQLPEELESPTTLPESEFYEDSDTPTMERVVDIFPPSVRGFTLIQLEETQESKRLFYGLADLKAEKLPNLKRLTFEHPDPLEDEELKVGLKEAGVGLWSWKKQL